jgi:hypothetical protein
MWVPISKARKEDYVFYGGMFDVLRNGKALLVSRNSYMYDQFDTHVENVEHGALSCSADTTRTAR